MKGLRAATSLLTRVPVGDPKPLTGAAPWFPVVGGLVGLATAGIYVVGRLGLPTLLAAGIAVGSCVWVTGAFHEDGLADTADAFGGGRTREDIVRIMRDPRLGTYGVSALVLSLLLRVGAVAALEGRAALALLPAAHALSRAGAIALVGALAPARPDGLGSTYGSVVTRRQVAVCAAVAVLIGVVTIGPLAAAAIVVVGATTLMVGALSTRKIGGVTGDVLGAAQQVAEIVVLLLGVAAFQRGWIDVPWWS